MTNPLRLLLILGTLLTVAACADEHVEPQKSPCVGLEGSPCGPKRQVNKDLVENVVVHADAKPA